MANEDQELEVISGDGSELDVSPVYNHLNVIKPKTKTDEEKQEIVIPKTKEEREKENKQ